MTRTDHLRSGTGLLRLVALAVVCAAGVAGCGESGSPAGTGAESVGLATSDAPEGTGMDALLVGRLAADPTSGCLWLVPVGEAGENSEDRVSVIWPKGFAARREPFRVYRPNGELVASEGDVLHTAGGFIAEAPETPVQGLERCRVGAQVWLLGSVDKVDRAAP